MMEKGVFYGVSLGPGDPELVTLKAIRLMERVPVIAYPMTNFGTTLALDIAKAVVDLSDKELIRLTYSMEKDEAKQHEGHIRFANEIAAYLREGKDVAMLNLGDISVYSTYSYLRDLLLDQGFETEMIPGVTSFCAIASRLKTTLVEKKEQLHIAADAEDVRALCRQPGTKVLMKSGAQMPEVYRILKEEGKLFTTSMISNCGMEDEEIFEDLSTYDPEKSAGYFTTLIIR